jgi:hypothetical protein
MNNDKCFDRNMARPNTFLNRSNDINEMNRTMGEMHQATPYRRRPTERVGAYSMTDETTRQHISSLEQGLDDIFSSGHVINNDNTISEPSKHTKNAFGAMPRMLEDYTKPDYTDSTQNLLVNNVSKNAYITTPFEYSVIIDSNDRDVTKYKNPFNYRVNFNDIAGSLDANIFRNFTNVKYIRIDRCILPSRYYFVKQATSLSSTDFDTVKALNLTDNALNETFALTSTDISGSFALIDVVDVLSDDTLTFTRYIKWCQALTYPSIIEETYELIFTFNSDSGSLPQNISLASPVYPSNEAITRYKMKQFNIVNDKYTLLHIDEFSNANDNTTSDSIRKAFSVLFYDGAQSGSNFVSPRFTDKVFRSSSLGKINRLSISFKDYNGNQLKTNYDDYVDYEIPSTRVCNCSTNIDGYFERDYRCSCTYFRHMYFQKFQNLIVLKIGVIETDIEKNLF